MTGEKLISIAEKENKSNIQKLCDLLTGIVDLFSFILIVLPLYPNPINGYIYSVNLFAYTETTSFNRMLYWIMFLALVLVGAVKIIITQFELNKGQKIVTAFSIVLSILAVLFLAMTREAYAVTIAFFLFVVKGILLFKHIKSEK